MMTLKEREAAFSNQLNATLKELARLYGFTMEPVSVQNAQGQIKRLSIEPVAIANWSPPPVPTTNEVLSNLAEKARQNDQQNSGT